MTNFGPLRIHYHACPKYFYTISFLNYQLNSNVKYPSILGATLIEAYELIAEVLFQCVAL